jgi:hypothetical protein
MQSCIMTLVPIRPEEKKKIVCVHVQFKRSRNTYRTVPYLYRTVPVTYAVLYKVDPKPTP